MGAPLRVSESCDMRESKEKRRLIPQGTGYHPIILPSCEITSTSNSYRSVSDPSGC